jgi:hypothetical protein
MRQLIVFVVAFGCLAMAQAAEPAFPVLDIAAVPNLQADGRAAYADFLLVNLPRAFALASDGHYGWFGGAGTVEDARTRALKSCTDKGGTDCSLYAEDLRVVWRGRAAVMLPQSPGTLSASHDFALVPDQRYFWFGPTQARGVFVWGHGKSAALRDERTGQPQAYVRAFNNAGFDVVRFQRAPEADYPDAAADFLRQGLAKLRANGWRTVVVAGQSRGAWNSLQMLDTPGLADAVIAVSPASFNNTNQSAQEADLYRILHAARSPAARVAVVQFNGDIYVRGMPARVDMLRGVGPPLVAAMMVIDEPQGITGHSGGDSATFARRYGRCLLRFVTEPAPPPNCP